MFTRFESHFHLDYPSGGIPDSESMEPAGDPELFALQSQFAGMSFNNGLYRVMDRGIMPLAGSFIETAFPTFSHRARPFAYDWLGRIFALDSGRFECESRAVTMFEPGTGEALEIPCDLLNFHESELVDYGEAALALSFYERWLASGGAVPSRDQCVGYKRPLFIGGKDEAANLEISDLDVYWSLSGQLLQKIRNLSPGTGLTP
jgi:hypothetical protein